VEASNLKTEANSATEEASPPVLGPRDLWLQKRNQTMSLELLDPRLRGVRIYNINGGILPPPEDGLGVAEFRSISPIVQVINSRVRAVLRSISSSSGHQVQGQGRVQVISPSSDHELQGQGEFLGYQLQD